MIVVDTSVLVHGVLPGEHGGLVRRLAAHDPEWVAPPLWRFELRNGLATAMRLRGLPLARAIAAFEAAESLVVDAEFVHVAERLDTPLVTTDRKLARAFPGRIQTLQQFTSES